MKSLLRALILLFSSLLVASVIGIVVLIAAYAHFSRDLPQIDQDTEFTLEEPLRIYSREDDLIGEYGVQRRIPKTFEEIPESLVLAFISSEDDRFYKHPGVDYQGLIRAGLSLVTTGERGQGGSTITMQLARNFFLTPQKSYERKIKEIFLALKMERELSKEKILELYLNKIYLGNRAYGVAAAAQVYYGKELSELSLAQTAMIAGLPKAPSRFNPIANPQRALQRREYVLRRMLELNHIDSEQHAVAMDESVTANLQQAPFKVEAGYAIELVRAEVVRLYGVEAYTLGLKVTTTISAEMQAAANAAIDKALIDYDRRHGYRGPLAQIDLSSLSEAVDWDETLDTIPSIADAQPAVVLEVEDRSAKLYLGFEEYGYLDWDGMNWAKPYRTANDWGPLPEKATQFLKPGDIVRVRQMPIEVIAKEAESDAVDLDTLAELPIRWQLEQTPEVQGSLVALDPKDGAIRALVGGYNYSASKFNRATQARRQPGSAFKPFLYSAALDNGYTPATLINDAPVVYDSDELEAAWRPENYSGKFYGPTRLREALYKSRNLVSIRILQGLGIGATRSYVRRFGFEPSRLPRDLSLALGSGTVTPIELATAYAVFANDGYRIEPWLVDQIQDKEGTVIYRANPVILCDATCEEERERALEEELTAELASASLSTEAASELAASAEAATDELPEADAQAPSTTELEEGDSELDLNAAILPVEEELKPLPPRYAERVITPQTSFLINSMLRDVVMRGTATRARQLGRKDLAGKTGTTNDQKDAWFAGFNREMVAISWVGFDDVSPLGRGEVGGRAALPMWMDFMRVATKDHPEAPLIPPPGISNIRISAETGERTSASDPQAIFEVFNSENVPDAAPAPTTLGDSAPGRNDGATIVEELF